MQKFPNHLGSGWTKVIQGIQVALRDRKLAVVEEGLKVLEGALQAAVAADVFPQLQPAILGLCVTAATLEEQPHLCFAALACIERVADVLLHQQVGTSVRIHHVLLRIFPASSRLQQLRVSSTVHSETQRYTCSTQ